MNISFLQTSVMGCVQGNCVGFNNIFSRIVRQIMRIVECWIWSFKLLLVFILTFSIFNLIRTRSITEVGIFIHIEPNSRKLNFFVEKIEHITPISGCIRVEEVDKSGCSWPNSTSQLITFGILDENTSGLSFFISNTIINFDSCIDNRNVSIFA